MKRTPSSCNLRQRGVALVSVIALVTLLAFLVVALLLRLTFYREVIGAEKGAVQARQLADYGASLVVSELRAELETTAASIVPTSNGGRYYDVANVENYSSYRALADETLSADNRYITLIKQSVAGCPFAVGEKGELESIASDVSTASAARGGRAISPERWLAPRFLPSDATLRADQVPDWIYLARNGGHPTSFLGESQGESQTSGQANPDFVVGRLAYQVYDTSGLLDANVAGFGEGSPQDELQRKGSLLWTDLATLPGGSRDLAEWRNDVNWSQAYQEILVKRGQQRGWLSLPEDASGRSNVFLSRGDLLAFHKSFPNYLSEESLPFFTHFSRETNAPSWGPENDAADLGGSGSGAFKYYSNRSSDQVANRLFNSVRVVSPFTRRLPPFPAKDEVAIPAREGEPLMVTRFPLRAIELFQLKGQENRIAEFFGLSREGAEWRYNALTSDNQIKTLSEVAQEGREPNFFEVLNAGLLSGSLGQTNGVWGGGPLFDNHDMDRVAARQVLRIGACIIDQYDEDNDPTVIAPVSAEPFGTAELVNIAGVENVPYIDVIGQMHITRRDLTGYPNWPWISAYYQLQLWNPHRNASDADPGNYRVISEGESYVNISWWPQGWPGGGGFPEDGAPFLATDNTSFMEFSTPLSPSYSNVGDRLMFERPVQLMGDLIGAHSPDSVLAGSNGNAFAGIYLGKVQTGSDNNARRRYRSYGEATGHIKFDRPVSIKLQKEVLVNGQPTWLTYQTIPRIEHHHGNVPWPKAIDDAAYEGEPQLRITYARSDPRTLRFGMGTAGGGTSPKVTNQTIWPSARENLSWSNRWEMGPAFRGATGTFGALSQNPDGVLSYAGKDGVRRHHDGRDDLGYTDGSPYSIGEARPLILNRPFRSVAEMGSAFRDEPWATLNFHSDLSADSGLLDLFSLTQTPVRAGTVNLNRAPVEVLAALIANTAKDPIRGGVFDPATAGLLASSLRKALDERPIATSAGIARIIDQLGDDGGKQAYEKEALISALADVHNARTWNLTIDVIAQSGRLLPSADDLSDFRVEGEQRLWVHLAIDRISGKVIEQEVEVVY